MKRRIPIVRLAVGAALGSVLWLACARDPAPVEHPKASDVPQAAAPAPADSICCLREEDKAVGEFAPNHPVRLTFDLHVGDVLELVADQTGADVALSLSGPAGRPLLRLDSPVGQREPEDLVFVAGQGGLYTASVESLGHSEPGTYDVRVARLRPASDDDRKRARAVASLAEAHELRRAGAWAEAALSYQGAAEAWRHLGDGSGEANALEWAARSLSHEGRKREAAELFARSVEGFRASGTTAREARALDRLGGALRLLGRLEEASSRYHQALGLWRQLGDRVKQARTLTDIANLHKAEGELSAAEREYKGVLELWQELGRGRDAAITRANLAGIYSVAGDPKLALDLLSRSLAELGGDVEPKDHAFVLGESGRVHVILGQREEAMADYRRALALLRQTGSREGEVPILDGLARLEYSANDYAKARELFLEASALPEAERDPRWEATLLQNVAWTYLHQGDPAKALPLFHQALPATRRADFPAGEATVLYGIARVERALGHLEAASTWAERALEEIEVVRSGSDRLDERSELLASHQNAFDFAVDTLMELSRRHPKQGYDRLAFDASERSKSRRLLEALSVSSERRASSGEASAGLLETLQKRVNRAEEERLRLLAGGAGEPEFGRAEQALRAALEDLRSEQDWIASSSSAPNRVPRPLRLEELQRSVLAPDTLLLSYDLGEERSYLWAVSKERLASYALPSGASLEQEARSVARLLSHSDERLTSDQVGLRSGALAATLLGPAASEIEAHRRLVVSVEGSLHTIPIGALPDPTGDGEPLLARHEILYVPSASTLGWLESRRELSRRQAPDEFLAVVADPVFGVDDKRVRNNTRSPGGLGAATESSALAGEHLQRLRHAGEEADAVLSEVAPDRRFSARDFAARKELVTSGALSGYRILHFATHSWASANQPELSALVLSRVDSNGGAQDGVLWAHEIAGLHLSAELVVLSSCDSGLGTAIHGEGLVGLSHAFFQAGTPRIVASLWRVNDRSAVELMKLFYDGFLGEGLPVAEALRRAQLAMRADPRWRRPYYWAGFVAEGTW